MNVIFFTAVILYSLMMWVLFSSLFLSKEGVFLVSCTSFFTSLNTSQAVKSMDDLSGFAVLQLLLSGFQGAKSPSLREGVFLCRPVSDWSCG